MLATGLSGLYSALPRTPPAEDEALPEVDAFVSSLQFCNSVLQVLPTGQGFGLGRGGGAGLVEGRVTWNSLMSDGWSDLSLVWFTAYVDILNTLTSYACAPFPRCSIS